MEDEATKSDKGVWLCQTISTAEIKKASKEWPTEEGGDEWLSRLLGYLE